MQCDLFLLNRLVDEQWQNRTKGGIRRCKDESRGISLILLYQPPLLISFNSTDLY